MSGVSGNSGLSGVSNIFGGLSMWRPNPLLGAFTARMDKRAAPGPFDRAPIVQGPWDVSTDGDDLSFALGAQLGNPADEFYTTFDYHQGTISMWITPEQDGGDGLFHAFLADVVQVILR